MARGLRIRRIPSPARAREPVIEAEKGTELSEAEWERLKKSLPEGETALRGYRTKAQVHHLVDVITGNHFRTPQGESYYNKPVWKCSVCDFAVSTEPHLNGSVVETHLRDVLENYKAHKELLEMAGGNMMKMLQPQSVTVEGNTSQVIMCLACGTTGYTSMIKARRHIERVLAIGEAHMAGDVEVHLLASKYVSAAAVSAPVEKQEQVSEPVPQPAKVELVDQTGQSRPRRRRRRRRPGRRKR